jgi:Lar family restriction alleviation protein
MSELKNCPFCGSEAKIYYSFTDGCNYPYVSCRNHVCGASIDINEYINGGHLDDYAIKTWNRRVERED